MSTRRKHRLNHHLYLIPLYNPSHGNPSNVNLHTCAEIRKITCYKDPKLLIFLAGVHPFFLGQIGSEVLLYIWLEIREINQIVC